MLLSELKDFIEETMREHGDIKAYIAFDMTEIDLINEVGNFKLHDNTWAMVATTDNFDSHVPLLRLVK